MKMFAEYTNYESPNFDSVQLSFSCLYFISGNHKWFCRIWEKDWISQITRRKKYFGEAYGRNKFEAYRLALKDLELN